jgi:membrane protein
MPHAREGTAGTTAARPRPGHRPHLPRLLVATPGIRATTPRQLSVRGWLQVLGRAGRHVMSDQLPLLSAGIAFFAVLSIAPVLVTALSVYGAVHTPEQALRELSGVVALLPAQLRPVVADQLASIAAASSQVLTRRGLTGLLFALWTATTATTYLLDGLTLAYHETETRRLVRRSGLALLLVLAGAVLLGGVLVGAGAVWQEVEGAPGPARAVAHVGVWVSLGVLMVLVLGVLYRVGPDRKQARWCWVSWGATGATVLWLATSAALFAYVQRLGTYESTYGSLAGVAISMFWLWITVLLVMLGAVVNAESERQTAHDSTVGPARPLGEREAVVADSTPPYDRD